MVKGPTALAYVRASSKGSKAETTGSSFKRQQESTAAQAKNSGVHNNRLYHYNIAYCKMLQTFQRQRSPGDVECQKEAWFQAIARLGGERN